MVVGFVTIRNGVRGTCAVGAKSSCCSTIAQFVLLVTRTGSSKQSGTRKRVA